MAKVSNREKILSAGLRIVHENGFGGAGVRDIIKAAGVPQGSFTNNFVSKEAFGVEILNIYFNNIGEIVAETLLNDSERPIERLKKYIDANRKLIVAAEMRNGCLYGNFSAEVVDYSETIRLRLVEILVETRSSIAYCLEAAVAAGELNSKSDTKQLADFILSSLQGAVLLSKADRSIEPFDQFRDVLFSIVLKP